MLSIKLNGGFLYHFHTAQWPRRPSPWKHPRTKVLAHSKAACHTNPIRNSPATTALGFVSPRPLHTVPSTKLNGARGIPPHSPPRCRAIFAAADGMGGSLSTKDSFTCTSIRHLQTIWIESTSPKNYGFLLQALSLHSLKMPPPEI